jgi:hypothetical protein
VPLGFVVASLLTVLLVYTALYWASLIIILKPLIIYLASVNATGLRPVLNYQVFIIWLTSPFNAYGSLIFHYSPWLYFIESVIVPTVILTAEVIIALWTSEYMLGRPVLNELFLCHSFALAFVASYMTSLIVWIGYGKPSFGTSIYTEYMFAATVYVAVISTRDLTKRLMVSKNTLTRRITAAIIANVMLASVAIYLAAELLFIPPVPLTHIIEQIPRTHIVGLIPIVTLLMMRHKGIIKLCPKAT